MKLEDQVVSLELSQRLKELGVQQESLFYWCEKASRFEDPRWVILDEDEAGIGNSLVASAFTVAELGELLPGMIMVERVNPCEHETMTEAYLEISHKHEYGREYGIRYDAIGRRGDWLWARTEADARAKMVIYLAEKGDKEEA